MAIGSVCEPLDFPDYTKEFLEEIFEPFEEDEHYTLKKVSYLLNGSRIYGYLLIPKENKPMYPAVVITHGFMARKEYLTFLAEQLAKDGYIVFAYDTRGFGESEGKKAVLWHGEEDVERAFNYVYTLPNVDRANIAVLGHSMGASNSLLFGAKDGRVKTVIAIAPYANISEIVLFPPSKDVEIKSSPIYYVSNFSAKSVLYVVGERDRICPKEQSEKLFNKTNVKKRIVIIKGEGHLLIGKRDEFVRVVEDWLDEEMALYGG